MFAEEPQAGAAAEAEEEPGTKALIEGEFDDEEDDDFDEGALAGLADRPPCSASACAAFAIAQGCRGTPGRACRHARAETAQPETRAACRRGG